ncbi:MAG: excisionase family DNA-binding protein [Pseudonocardiaceae bacterium]
MREEPFDRTTRGVRSTTRNVFGVYGGYCGYGAAGCSRQHVVDLCDAGELAFLRIGTHRRLQRSDVECMLRPLLTRDQERSLWLHHAVAGRLTVDPDAVLAKARRNIETMLRAHPTGRVREQIRQWQALIGAGLDGVLDVLTSRTGRAVELRQNSPFAGVLPEPDRRRALDAFRTHWRHEHAA